MNAPTCFVTDTGLRSGGENVALDRAQRFACARGDADAWLRFYGTYQTVSLGAHETAADAIREEYCSREGIGITRRLTGGGSAYLDPDQLCWTLALSHPAAARERGMLQWMALLSTGAVQALRWLGLDARFETPNELEVAARKIGWGFLAVFDDAVLFQGSVLLDADVETALRALKLPMEKLSPAGILTARQRLITLKECGIKVDPEEIKGHLLNAWSELLGFNVRCRSTIDSAAVIAADGGFSRAEDEAAAADASPRWLRGFVKTSGGVIHAAARLSDDGNVIEQLRINGSVHVFPPDLFARLAGDLAGAPVADLGARLDQALERWRADMIGVTSAHLHRALRLALNRRSEQRAFGLTPLQANTLMVHSPDVFESAPQIVDKATAMLVPYCAKPTWCKWRARNGCSECGLCEVGEAYRLAREHGMQVISVTNYEHLCETLQALRAEGAAAYIGMCCQHFYIKREHAFSEAGIPALLMDISGSNCYELRQEEQAYEGRFQAQSRLNLDVLTRVMAKPQQHRRRRD